MPEMDPPRPPETNPLSLPRLYRAILHRADRRDTSQIMSAIASAFPAAIDATPGNMKKTNYGAVPTGPIEVVIENPSRTNG